MTDASEQKPTPAETSVVDTPPPAPAPASGPGETTAPTTGTPDDELLALVDRLTDLLERSDLIELEVEAGETGLVLRKPEALGPILAVAATTGPAPERPAAGLGDAEDAAAAGQAAASRSPASGSAPAPAPAPSKAKSVKAPLTGIFYNAPSPGSPPYVTAGGEVAVGQIIGLIEAMKLFNEIKSDQAGRVVRVVAETGTLVKAKQPLIEVEPL